MAPRKSAVAGEDDPCPSLKLIMEKGPLSGQTNDFGPGSRIHIGRVVRGNKIAVKDAGVSSKHLVIQVEAVSDPGRRSWAVTDLGSSNGTFLNGEQLKPSEPAVLSDGDVIKIGEQTSINVKFEVTEGQCEVNCRNVRRNARRRVRNQVAELLVINEDSELGLGDKCLGDISKNEDLGNEGVRLEIVDEGKARGRRTRGSIARETEDLSEQVEVKMENLGKASLRGATSSKMEENLEFSKTAVDEDEEKSEKAAEVEVKQVRNVRRTRSSKKVENLEVSTTVIGEDEEKSENAAEVEVEQARNVRRTKSSKQVENLEVSTTVIGEDEEKSENVAEAEAKKVRNVRRTRSSKKVENLEVSTIVADEDAGKSDDVADVEVKQVRNLRKTRSSKINENTLEDLNINRDRNLGQRVSVRRTRSSRQEEGIGDIGLSLDVIEAKKNKRGTRGRKKLPVEMSLGEQKEVEPNLEDKICENVERELEDDVDELVDRLTEREGDAGLPSTSGVKESTVDVERGKTLADLEKMTLGEWFDFLEVFLPKQIIDATEEMISEMRQKSERLHEFMLQQKNAKEKREGEKDWTTE